MLLLAIGLVPVVVVSLELVGGLVLDLNLAGVWDQNRGDQDLEDVEAPVLSELVWDQDLVLLEGEDLVDLVEFDLASNLEMAPLIMTVHLVVMDHLVTALLETVHLAMVHLVMALLEMDHLETVHLAKSMMIVKRLPAL